MQNQAISDFCDKVVAEIFDSKPIQNQGLGLGLGISDFCDKVVAEIIASYCVQLYKTYKNY
jgi:hypothetical protein